MSRLEIRLGLAFAGFRLDVGFATAIGGITALFGASGSGKTTALRCIAGIVRAPNGYVALDSECWQDEGRGHFVPPHRRACGYVFQEASLFPHLSVRRNLEYGWKRVPLDERRVVFEQAVGLLGIETLLERQPVHLSGGERQRVALARAVLASPRLLLMDEPLASIDAPRRAEILYYIERLRDELGIPLVYVSHSVDEVVRLADLVVELAEGKVVAVGPVHETIGRHESGAVLDAVVIEQDLDYGLARLGFSGGELFASDVDALPGERVRVRIQARDVALALSRPSDSSFLNVLSGTVASIGGESGASVDIRIDLAGTPLIARITRKSAATLRLAPGRAVHALIKAVAIDRHSVGYA